jgi:hypothetical protein
MKKLIILTAFLIAIIMPCGCKASSAVLVNGQSVTMFLSNCQGTAPFTFQWYKNGTAITGATGVALPSGTVGISASAYSIQTVAITDSGAYTCVVTNPAGSTTSDTVTLSFIVAPSGAITGILVNGVLK